MKNKVAESNGNSVVRRISNQRITSLNKKVAKLRKIEQKMQSKVEEIQSEIASLDRNDPLYTSYLYGKEDKLYQLMDPLFDVQSELHSKMQTIEQHLKRNRDISQQRFDVKKAA